MKTTLALAITIVLANCPIQAEKLANGIEFRTPAGWTTKTTDQAAALLPSDMVREAGGDPAEIYLIGVPDGLTNARDPQAVAAAIKQLFPSDAQMRLAGAPQPFQATGGNGYVYRFDALSDGTPVRFQVYMVELRNGGLAGLIAVARPALMAKREATIASVAATLARSQAPAAAAATMPPLGSSAPAAAPAAPAARGGAGTNGPLAAQWDQRLRGRKLYKFSSYSSSYGSGGYNSQRTLLLSVNGTYDYRSSGSVSVTVPGASGGSSSNNGDQGKWRIYQQAGKVVLELASNTGSEPEVIVLTSDGTKTLLNGNRWLVGD